MSSSITAVVLAKNEEAMIANCLETLKWCDHRMVVDNGSSDNTVAIAHRTGAEIVQGEGSFAEARTAALERVTTSWILYIDADERVTPALAQEIRQVMMGTQVAAYALNRRNICYGHELKHGGWNTDWVERLFQTKDLQGWEGDIHEHAVYQGKAERLVEPLFHLTHRSVRESLLKSADWTGIEARLLVEAGVPPVTLKTLLRKTFMETYRRAIAKQGRKDGMAGWIEALTQGFNRFLVYAQVWELQQQPQLSQQYQNWEEKIAHQWQTDRK